MASGSVFVVKVPKWISDAWHQLPPEALVADLDLDAGKLKMAGGSSSCPASLDIDHRSDPGLFAFSRRDANSEDRIVGPVTEVLQVKLDMKDMQYRNVLQQRRSATTTLPMEEATLETSSRSCHAEQLNASISKAAELPPTKKIRSS
mmetsp:Transcript_18970/g.30809  ORF Transcript_18970/g.30809 Transcript_18970/m.30809 type:complete len:147 (-) Transcript_18970:40-480(-)